MEKKILFFVKNNYLLLFLLFYGVFLIFYKWSGSLMGDEATYSQVAKESLLGNSFLTLHWKQQLWFEKPPLIIWLTALSFKTFGISETSAHIFPGIFGILSSLALYSIATELFKNKLAGFFAGFVFLATPIILLYNRNVMMDIPVGFFASICLLALLKIRAKNNNRWWLLYFIAMGLGILTKDIMGFLPLIFISLFAITEKNLRFLKDKYFLLGLACLFLIVAPWHLYMSIKFGTPFWNDYLGFHVWKRFSTQIFQHPWKDATNLGYLKLLLLRSGIWFWLLIGFSVAITTTFVIKSKGTLKIKTPPYSNIFSAWTHSNRKTWIILLFWAVACIIPFFLAATKLPNYMVLVFFPISIFVGGFLAFLFKNSLPASILCVISLINFFPITRLRASDFGEAHFLFPKLLIRFFNFNDKALLLSAFALLIILILLYMRLRKDHALLFNKVAIIIFVGMNTLIPFSPTRNEFLKGLGQDIIVLSKNQPITLYYKIQPDQYSFDWVEAFYLPPQSRIINIESNKPVILAKNQTRIKHLCFVEKSFSNEEILKNAVRTYNEGFLLNCFLEK